MTPIERIAAARLLPVLRTRDAGEAVDVVAGLVAGGVDVVELTTTIDGWEHALVRVRADHPDACIGVGTVLSTTVARDAVQRGADFLVSPRLVPDVRTYSADAGACAVGVGRDLTCAPDIPARVREILT